MNNKRIIYYTTNDGRCPYDEWLTSLDNKIKSIIENRIERLIDGLYGDCKKLSNSSLSELRFFIGKGYRVYFKDLTNILVIIIAGSDKKNQKQIIKQAENYLKDFIERNSK
ncbi:type II toxin-antitoxin system RelE/ParE family toxin [bacterium]|nr:type II toxin-antitoxin system RelE/ParE family toxin [bacterium]